MRAALCGLLLCIWIMAAAGCSRLRRSKTRAACVFGRSDALLGNCDAGRRKWQSFCGIAMPCAGAVRRTVGLDHLEQFSL